MDVNYVLVLLYSFWPCVELIYLPFFHPQQFWSGWWQAQGGPSPQQLQNSCNCCHCFSRYVISNLIYVAGLGSETIKPTVFDKSPCFHLYIRYFSKVYFQQTETLYEEHSHLGCMFALAVLIIVIFSKFGWLTSVGGATFSNRICLFGPPHFHLQVLLWPHCRTQCLLHCTEL